MISELGEEEISADDDKADSIEEVADSFVKNSVPLTVWRGSVREESKSCLTKRARDGST